MILGVTGNIASGKSSVAKEFKKRGAVIVDADQLARDVVRRGSNTLNSLVATFGDAILQSDGSLDRERLGGLVFADAEARTKLNAIVHPAIASLAVERLEELQSKNGIPLIVYEAPLLFEAKAENRVDKVLVVQIDEQEQLKRLMKRDGLPLTEAKKRMDAQMSQDEKLRRADFIIDNSGAFEKTQEQVERLWEKLVGEALS